MEQKETKTMIMGHIVVHDVSAAQGIRYLIRELDDEERRVFFDQAYNHGSAVFEDHMGYKFELLHHGSEYKLERHI